MLYVCSLHKRECWLPWTKPWNKDVNGSVWKLYFCKTYLQLNKLKKFDNFLETKFDFDLWTHFSLWLLCCDASNAVYQHERNIQSYISLAMGPHESSFMVWNFIKHQKMVSDACILGGKKLWIKSSIQGEGSSFCHRDWSLVLFYPTTCLKRRASKPWPLVLTGIQHKWNL